MNTPTFATSATPRRRSTRNIVRMAAAGAAATAILASTTAHAAAEAKAPEHCVVEVVDQLATGELVVSEPTCYSEFSAAMSDAGLGAGIDTSFEATVAAAAASSTIGIHYDGANFTGASLTVSGTNCLGGYLNLSAAWNNRVSSTISNFCGRIRHWAGANKTGSSQDTLPSGNLVAPLNNAASSIQYLN